MALEWLHRLHCLKRKNSPAQFFFYPISYFHGNVWNNWCNFTWCIVQAVVLAIVWEPCPPKPSAWPFLNQALSSSSFVLIRNTFLSWAIHGAVTRFCNLWSLTCPHINALCHAWGAEDNGERGHEKWGGSCEGMLCHKRVSDGHIGGLVKHAGTLKRYLACTMARLTSLSDSLKALPNCYKYR